MPKFDSTPSAPSTRPTLRLVPGRPAEPTDAELVAALREGESWAATMAWNRHAPMVYRLLDRALGSAQDSEDLTQEVFWRVFAAVRRLNEPAAFRSFIYTTAVRMLRWHLRRKRIRRFLTLSGSGELPEAAVRGTDSEGRELLGRFYQLLDSLAADDRTAYALRYIEELRLEEIAKVTGASLATVKRRIRRASDHIGRLVGSDPDLADYFVATGDPR